MSNTKTVLVTGDVIVDHHIYEGRRLKPDSFDTIGTQEKEARGGAGLLYQILDEVSRQKNQSGSKEGQFELNFGLNNDVFKELYSNLHSYAVWKPCKSQNDYVWRMVQPLGYGNSPKLYFPYFKFVNKEAASNQNVLVIDDGGLGFRLNTQKEAWPEIIQKEGSKSLEWIILKMSNPVGQGDLWRHLSTKFKEKLVLILSIDDIRREEVRITRGISWERTALDLVDELCFNPDISMLLNCRHLIINFSSEGALHVDNPDSNRVFRLIYDPAHMENEWKGKIEGHGLGFMSCFTAGIVSRFVEVSENAVKNENNVDAGIKAGLSAMRTMHLTGHGQVNDEQIGFPLTKVAEDICRPSNKYASIALPELENAGDSINSRWTIMTAHFKGAKESPLPLYDIGIRAALLGPKALTNIPYAKFGKLFTVDRNEIESLRNIRKMIIDYEKYDKGKKPLSLAVFGSPGAGKSFGIIQIAEGVLGKDVPILEFNLSQFAGPEDLIGAFHQVRDRILEGTTPVVFWDEFDSKKYLWLQYLLSPMQDGKFQEGQLTHPIGKCIFIFAGGTSFDMENFGEPKEDKKAWDKYKLKKGPDFVSRLSGYLNVLGPNRRQCFDKKTKIWIDDPMDVCFPVRRGLLMRSILKLFGDEYLKIDRGILSALIEVEKYNHGARSMEKILMQLKQPGDDVIRRSNLPPAEIMSIHADYESFIKIANRHLEFKTNADLLAPSVHEFYRKLGEKEGWLREEMDKDYNDLPEDYKEDNRQAAARIPQALELVGLYVVPDSMPSIDTYEEIQDVLERNLELLAEAEHDGWMEHKIRNGWVYGEKRDDAKKINPALLPYKDLSEQDKDKDRNSVRYYQDILKEAKYKIVSSLNVEKND